MPMSEYLAGSLLKELFGDVSYTIPSTTYVGVAVAPTWQPSTDYTVGEYVVGSAFDSSNRHIYKCTAIASAGASGSTEPIWSTGAGTTTTDNQVTWTECTDLLDGSTITGLECAASGYGRVSVTNNTTDWGNYSAGPPAQISNLVAIDFADPSVLWGQAVALLLYDASTAGNLLAWALLQDDATMGAGSSPAFAANALTFTLT